MSFPVPWGAYIAGHSNNTTNSLYDFTGNGRNAIVSGTPLVAGNNSGNGTIKSSPHITGTKSTIITWPTGSIPTVFTICSITRRTVIPDGNYSRILNGSFNFCHGHYSSGTGVAYYNSWKTGDNRIPTTSTDWLVMCGTNGTNSIPNNILANGTPVGTSNGGDGNGTLSINTGLYPETTNFGFQQVLIWNVALTNIQLSTISSILMNYLSTGSITYPWSGGPTYSLPHNYVFGKFDTSYNVLNQVVTTGTVYSPHCVSSNGKNMISFVGTYPNFQTYYSNNYGATWALSNMATTILGGNHQCCSPVSFPNVFYVGAINGSNKVFRSADGGATWTIISTAIGNAAGICVNDNDTILYISSFRSSMYYATKAGNTNFNYTTNTGTFTLTQITGSNNSYDYGTCYCSPDGTFLYGTATSSNRAFKYNFNNTASFDATLTSAYNINVCSVAMSSNGNYLYACLYLNASYALIKSINGGTSFSDITGIITKNSACLVYCDPTGQYLQVTHNTNWWVSSNYGTTFTVYSGGAIPFAPNIFNNNQFVSLISSTTTQYGPLTTPSYSYPGQPDSSYPCFKEGSKILRLDPNTDIESYVPVESLRPGDLIKTLSNGHKAVFHIGKKILPSPADDPDPRNRLYRLPKSISKEMTADLYITGEHCILHKSISDELKERVRKHMGDVYITEHQYRVPACIDDRAEQCKDNDPVTIWHFALENHSIYRNYGVYANGLLVESCSIQYLTEMSSMELL